MNNDIRLDLNKTQQYKNIRLEYLTPSTEIYIYKSYHFRKSGPSRVNVILPETENSTKQPTSYKITDPGGLFCTDHSEFEI